MLDEDRREISKDAANSAQPIPDGTQQLPMFSQSLCDPLRSKFRSRDDVLYPFQPRTVVSKKTKVFNQRLTQD